MSKEILTLQIGSFSNFIGTHFWNNADDIFTTENSSVLYRNGIQSYAPRLISIDFGQSLNLVPTDDHEVQWDKVLKVEKEKSTNAFLSSLDSTQDSHTQSFAENLEENVLFPTDFSKIYCHQKSIVPIQQHNFGLRNFNQGVELWQNEEWVYNFLLNSENWSIG